MSMPADYQEPADEDLWNEAMALLLSWQASPDDDAAREAVRAFCALGERHRAAWEEAKQVYRLAGSAVGVGNARERRKVSRRQAMIGLGALAVMGTGAAIGPGLWRRWQADYATEVAEIRQVELPDGSRLTLGPESTVEIAFNDDTRRLRLLDGMALCEVSSGSQPFEARAGELRALALGTSFELRQNGWRSFVGVGEGTVEISLGRREATTLVAGDWLSAGPDAGDTDRGHRDAGQTAAWRQNLLVAEREPVGAVVGEIARWRRGRVFIADPGLSRVPVSGLYDLRDPDAALAAVVAPYGGRVRQLSPWLTVLSRV